MSDTKMLAGIGTYTVGQVNQKGKIEMFTAVVSRRLHQHVCMTAGARHPGGFPEDAYGQAIQLTTGSRFERDTSVYIGFTLHINGRELIKFEKAICIDISVQVHPNSDLKKTRLLQRFILAEERHEPTLRSQRHQNRMKLTYWFQTAVERYPGTSTTPEKYSIRGHPLNGGWSNSTAWCSKQLYAKFHQEIQNRSGDCSSMVSEETHELRFGPKLPTGRDDFDGCALFAGEKELVSIQDAVSLDSLVHENTHGGFQFATLRQVVILTEEKREEGHFGRRMRVRGSLWRHFGALLFPEL